jgi:hypothetical protein
MFLGDLPFRFKLADDDWVETSLYQIDDLSFPGWTSSSTTSLARSLQKALNDNVGKGAWLPSSAVSSGSIDAQTDTGHVIVIQWHIVNDEKNPQFPLTRDFFVDLHRVPVPSKELLRLTNCGQVYYIEFLSENEFLDYSGIFVRASIFDEIFARICKSDELFVDDHPGNHSVNIIYFHKFIEDCCGHGINTLNSIYLSEEGSGNYDLIFEALDYLLKFGSPWDIDNIVLQLPRKTTKSKVSQYPLVMDYLRSRVNELGWDDEVYEMWAQSGEIFND